MNKPIRAECHDMCPVAEFNLRTRNNLVNALEKKLVDSKIELCLIKEYSRPAAGKNVKPSELRTVNTLLRTTHVLINE